MINNIKYNINMLLNKRSVVVNEYIHQKGKIYHLSDCAELIHSVFGHNVYIIYATDSQENVVGVLPLVHVKSIMFGNYLISMPYFNYGSVVADSLSIETLLIEHSKELGKKLKVSSIEYREIKERGSSWPSKRNKVNMVLDLPDNVDAFAKSIGSKRRSQIRRPIKEGALVRHGRKELLSDFYNVFSENMRDLGTPVYSKDFFEKILQYYPDNTHIFIVYLGEKPIGSAFLISFRNTLEIPWASTIKRYNSLSPNMLLYWEVISWAINNGFKYFDFGRTTVGSGTYNFKKQWGAKHVQLYWNYWLPSNEELPELNPDNPKFKIFINIWKRMPVYLANLIGPSIVKNLP